MNDQIDQITDQIMSAVCTDAGLNREVIKGIVSERFKLNKVCPFETKKNGKWKVKFQIYKDEKKEFRWRTIGRNGQVTGGNEDGYKRRSHCRKMIQRIIDGPHVIEEV